MADLVTNQEFYDPIYYFGSDQYNDRVITEFLYNAWDKTYSRTMERQIEFQRTMARTISLSEFKVDPTLNQKLKIPARTYTYKANAFELPIINKRKFIATYGNYNKPISLKAMMVDKACFSFGGQCSIGPYGFPDIYLYPTQYGYTYIMIIPTSSIKDDYEIYDDYEGSLRVASRIPPEILQDLISKNYKLTLQWCRHGSIYRTQTRLANIINKTASTITLPKTSALVSCAPDSDDMNSWDCYISNKVTGSGATGAYLYAKNICTLKSTNQTQVVFTLSKEFIDFIMAQNQSASIYIFHRPTRKSILKYTHESGKVPIFELDTPNPISSSSYLISQYDIGSDRMLNTEIMETTPTYYPNVIDFSKTSWMNKNLLIETYVLPYKDVSCQFDNPAQNYKDALGANYASVVSNNVKCPPILYYYDTMVPKFPATYLPDYPFEKSPVEGDVRAWKLNLLNIMSNHDPNMLKDLQQFLDLYNEKYISKSGSPKELKFTKKYVMDNSEFALVQKDDTIYFDELHGYFTFTSEKEDSPSLIYVNGALVNPTLEYYSVGAMHIYLPKSQMDTAMASYSSQDEQDRLTPVTIDAFPTRDKHGSSSISETHLFNSTDEMQKIFENIEIPGGFSINDLVFYLTGTREVLDKSKLKFAFEIKEYLIKHEDGTEDPILIDKGTPIEYLLTNEAELYHTMDHNPVILQESTSNIEVPDDLPDGNGTIADKVFESGDLMFGIVDPTLIGVSITVALCNGFLNRIFKGEDIIKANNILTIGNYIYGTDARKLEIYHNGILLDTSQYIINMPTEYAGVMTIDLSPINVQISPTSIVNVVVLPIPFVTRVIDLTSNNQERYNLFTNVYDAERNTFTGADTGIQMYRVTDPSEEEGIVGSPVLNFHQTRTFLDGMRLAYAGYDEYKIINHFFFKQIDLERAKKLKNPINNILNHKITVRYPSRGTDIYKMKELMHNTIQDSLI